MHDSVMVWLFDNLSSADVQDKTVLEVGAADLNGSPRNVIERLRPIRYLGVDSGPGRGVDMVVDATELVDTVGNDWDLVVSTEMLEHAQEWRAVVSQLKAAVAQEGLLVLTTRGPGFPYHAHPDDFWRFTRDDFARIFADFEILALDDDPKPGYPGVFLKARRVFRRYHVDLGAIEVAPVVRPKERS